MGLDIFNFTRYPKMTILAHGTKNTIIYKKDAHM